MRRYRYCVAHTLTGRYDSEGNLVVDFNSFYSQEWVQVATSFVYVILIIFIPFRYWRDSQKLNGQMKRNFIECAFDISTTVLGLLLAPVLYLGLYFMGSDNNFMLNDPLPWMCFVGSLFTCIDLIRSKMKLKIAKELCDVMPRQQIIKTIEISIKVALVFSCITLVYGVVMIGVTNLTNTSQLHPMLWFFTFMLTCPVIVYAATAKSIFFVSSAYATDAALGTEH